MPLSRLPTAAGRLSNSKQKNKGSCLSKGTTLFRSYPWRVGGNVSRQPYLTIPTALAPMCLVVKGFVDSIANAIAVLLCIEPAYNERPSETHSLMGIG